MLYVGARDTYVHTLLRLGLTSYLHTYLQEEEKPAEKEAFDLKLVSYDDKSKIKVIKEVRTISGLGLKEVSR